MIIKVNDKGINIDVSMSEELINKFGTAHATIPINFISNFKIKPQTESFPEVVELVDALESEYTIHFSMVTSINGISGFNSNLEVFNKINKSLFGFE